jgi:oxygen-independent coproporphyrinogen-3 oxidase
MGFQRISFGIQSFDDEELRRMERHYDIGLGCRMVSAALDIGFKNVNTDLIYGLPNQSHYTWISNLKVAIDLGVQTINMYPLTLRSCTQFGANHKMAACEFHSRNDMYNFYDTGVNILSSHYYQQSTMATFAKYGGGCRHEANEFNGIPTLGFGVSALSYSPIVHYASCYYSGSTPNSQVFKEYIEAIEKHEMPIKSGIVLNRDEQQRKYVILKLLHLGFDQNDYSDRFNEPLDTHFGTEFDILRHEGYIDECGTYIALSQRGRRLSNLVANFLASDTVKRLSRYYH